MSSIAERMFNVDALATDIRVLAPTQAAGIEHLYVLLDDAQKKGYAAGTYDATEQLEVERDNAWDDGYSAGVQDARVDPAKADRIVEDIIADGAASYYDAAEEAVDNWTAYAESVRD